MMNSIHTWLSEKSQFYKNWHSNNYHSAVHWSGLTAYSVLMGLFLTSAIYGTYVPDAYAAALPNLMVMGSDHIPDFSQDTSRATVTATKSGSWSDPTVWSSGSLPNSSQIVVIPSGKSITYDSTTGTAYTVFVQGELKYRNDIDTKLTVTNLEVDMSGYVEIGTASAPINSNVTAELVIANTPIDTSLDPEQWGTGFLSFGKVKIAGSTKNPTFIEVATEPLAGQTTITLSQTPTGWKVGDRIFIPDTRHYKTNEVTSGSPFWPLTPQWEEFTIQGISGNTITLNRALTYSHKGARDVNGTLDFLPHVGNLTRNVIIRSTAPTGTRGHVAMMHSADADIRYATFKDLGRTTYDPITTGTNQKGRYALHMHHVYGPLPSPANGYQFTLIGNAVDGGSTTHRFKWGITIHDSHYGLIQDNVVYNMNGAGIMTEDGNETMNVFDHNFVVRSDGTGDRGDSRGTSEWGYEGAGIWLRGPNNILRNNVVANFKINGIAYFHIYLGNVKIPNYKGADTTISGQYTSVSSYTLTIPEFNNNEIYGSGSVGLTNWWLGAEYNTPRASGTSVFKNTKIWHVADRAVYNYPGSNLTYDGLTIRGDSTVLQSASCCGIGYEGGDYFANNITFRNTDIQGMTIGMHISTNSGGTQLVENSTLRNKTNISFQTLYTSDCSATKITPRLAVIRNVKFMSIPGISGKNISMDYSSVPVRNLIQKDEVYVVDYNQIAGNNFRVYFNEADPNYYLPQGYYSSQYGTSCVSLMSSPVPGLTNTQAYSQYGIAAGGTPATCADRTTHPEINGITCPYTSIATAPLTGTVYPSGLVAGPVSSPSGPAGGTTGTTQTATVTMSVSPTSITSGSSATITWSSTVATSCTASGGWTGTKATSGTQTVSPTADTTYTLTCGGTNITSASKSVSVTVTSAQVQTPTATISASPTSVTSGSSSTLSWSSTNATSCTASGGWTGAKATAGSQSVSPTTNTTYTITCTSSTGATATQSVTVAVAVVQAPTVIISASPTSVTSGSSSTLSWSSTNANSCTASGGWTGAKTTSGTQIVNPTTSTTYTITCTGSTGTTVTQSVTVAVSTVQAPTLTLSASPASVNLGGSSTLNWSTTNALSCSASGAWSGAKATFGSQSVTPNENATYTLTCTGSSGATVTKSVVVTVTTISATVSISASPATITSGSSATLVWSSTNATSCTASGAWSGAKATAGSLVVSPTATSTYSLMCNGTNVTSASNSATINVIPPVIPSPTISISASPSSITYGNSSTLTWSATNVSSCSATGAWSGTKATSGSLSVSPTVSSTYTLQCTGTNGSTVSQSVTVSVAPAPLATVTISASPSSIQSGNSSTLTWSSTNATTCTAGGAWTGTKATSGSLVVNPAIDSTYTLTCSGANSTPVTQSVSISVAAAQPLPVLSMNVSDSSISSPGNVYISWSTSNATSCTASGAWSGTKSLSSIETVYVDQTSTYTLTCINSSLSSVSQSVTVTVASQTTTTGGDTSGGGSTSTTTPEPTPTTAPSVTFVTEQPNIKYGSSAVLYWSVKGADSVYISGIGNVPLVGNQTVAPTATTTYTLTATGNGTVSKSLTIGVGAPSNLVGYWKMNSEIGTDVYDSSAYGFTGILLNGGTWSVGYLGGSVKLDGVNDYVTFGHRAAFNITGDLTISAWINHRTKTGTDTIIAKGPCSSTLCPFSLRIVSSGALCFYQNNGAKGQEQVCTSTSIPLSTWNHVAVVRSGNQLSMYINGVLKKTTNLYRSGKANLNSLTIGTIGGYPEFSFDGRIDDVRLYNKAMTATDIKNIMLGK